MRNLTRFLPAALAIFAVLAASLPACSFVEGNDGELISAEPVLSDVGGCPTSDEIIPGEFYVVYSLRDNCDPVDRPGATSNIYVLKGNTLPNGRTDVWIFGSGYGNPDLDMRTYSPTTHASMSHDAVFDAGTVDSVIDDHLGLSDPALVRIKFISPHFHLDHLNQEFLTALTDPPLGYTINKAFIHAGDTIDPDGNPINFANCDSPCCGYHYPAYPLLPECQINGVNTGNPYGGVPFRPSVDQDLTVLGDGSEDCDERLIAFNTPSGQWEVSKAAGQHTDGDVNLDRVTPADPEGSDLRTIRVRGGGSPACSADPWMPDRCLHVHGLYEPGQYNPGATEPEVCPLPDPDP